jgi:hypothetical protein
MSYRFLDLADSFLGVERRLASEYVDGLVRPEVLDSLSAQAAMRSASMVEAMWNRDAHGLPETMEVASLSRYFAGHDTFMAERALEAMAHVGLSDLSDAALHSRYGDYARLLRNATSFVDPLDAMMLASASRANDAFGREAWLESCLPAFDSIMDLGESVWATEPLGHEVADLLQSLSGEQSVSAIRALGRATSARTRRGLYRELGASRQVEKLPAAVLQGAFTPTYDTEPSDELASPFLLVLVRNSPLTRYNRRCYELIAAFEAFLRQELDSRMQALHGAEWIHNIPSDYRSAWRRKFRQHHGREPDSTVLTAVLLSYSDLGDVMDFLIALHGGDDALRRDLDLRFQLIRMIRNCTVHQRPLLAHDVVSLQTAMVEVGRVLVPHLQ